MSEEHPIEAEAIAVEAVAAAVEAASPPAPSPEAELAAAVELAREEEATKRVKLETEARVEIARMEEPEWLVELKGMLAGMAATLEVLMASRQSIPEALEEPATTVIVDASETETQAADSPIVAETPLLSDVVDPQVVESPSPEPQPRRNKRRWT
jgi:hypothetical protein